MSIYSSTSVMTGLGGITPKVNQLPFFLNADTSYMPDTVSGAVFGAGIGARGQGSYDFDGVDDYIEINDNLNLSTFNPTAKEGVPKGMTWKPDGTSIFIIGSGNREIHKWNCSTAWDTNTAVFSQSSTVVFARETDPQALDFSSDGTKCYVLGNTGADVTYFSMSSAWDLSTLTWVGEFSVSGQVTDPRGIFIKPDGTSFYVIGDSPNKIVYQYTMSTAWDMSTASYASKSFDVSPLEAFPQGLSFKNDGTRMWIIGLSGDDITEYSLSTAWDVSTCTATGQVLYIGAQNTDPVDMFVSADGMILFVLGVTPNSRVYGYSLYSSYSLSNPLYSSGFTIVADIRPDTSGEGSAGKIFDRTHNSGITNGLSLYMGSSSVVMQVGGGTGVGSGAGSITMGNTYKVFATCTSAGLVSFYLNGVATGVPASSNAPNRINQVGKSRIGNRAGATDFTFDGKIGNVYIFPYVLSQEEITYMYNNY